MRTRGGAHDGRSKRDILDGAEGELQGGGAAYAGGLARGGVSAQDILDGGLIAGMCVIGERFKRNEIYVPEVLLAARAMKAGMVLLKPILADTGIEPIGRVVLGTVKGDRHDIGKNLVGMMLEGRASR